MLIPLLLFADDSALFSYSASGLQAQQHILQDFWRSRGLAVNVASTQVVGDQHHKSACAPLYLAGEEIARAGAFMYFGFRFCSTRGLSYAIEQLVVAAREAYLLCMAAAANCTTLHLRCKLFDS